MNHWIAMSQLHASVTDDRKVEAILCESRSGHIDSPDKTIVSGYIGEGSLVKKNRL